VSIVIFDSRVAVGSARAVYMSARAEELSGAELEHDVAFFDTASQAQGLTRRWALEDVLAPAVSALSSDGVTALGPRSRQQSRRPRRRHALGRSERTARQLRLGPQVANRRPHLAGEAEETGSRSATPGQGETPFARATNIEPPTGQVSPCAGCVHVEAPLPASTELTA
jgi:hypothetical protein